MNALLLQILVGAAIGAFVLFIWHSTRRSRRPKRPYLQYYGAFYSSVEPPPNARFGDKWQDTQTGKVYIRTSTGWKLYVAAPPELRKYLRRY